MDAVALGGPTAQALSLPLTPPRPYLAGVTITDPHPQRRQARRLHRRKQGKPRGAAPVGRRRRLRRLLLQVRTGRARGRRCRRRAPTASRLVVDPVSLDLLDGSAVDYVEDLGGAVVQGDQPQRRLGLRLRLQLFGLIAPISPLGGGVKLVTFNINGIRARLPRLLEYLDREQPDVACLQELKCADESLPIADIEAAGYGAVWHGQKGFNGVAILARGEAPALRQVGLARRSRRQPQPLHRGRGRRRDRRVDLSAQRQSDRHREVRLQAALDGAARASARRDLARRGAAGGAGRRLQRHPRGPRHLLAPGDGQ